MALTKCGECGREVSTSAATCPNCGARVKASAFKGCGQGCAIGVAALFGLLLLVLIISVSRGPSPSSSTPSAPASSVDTPGTVEVQGVRTSVAEVEKSIAELRSAGFITSINSNTNEIQVNAMMWAAVELNAKKGITLTCAQYFKAHGQSPLAELVDNRSGRKLASYGTWGGVKIGGDE
jgi:hypothetical protein